MNLHAMRQDYSRRELSEAQCADNPITQFEQWFAEAVAAQADEPSAMNLATAGADGKPTARMVLLKETRPDGFVFFSNYLSRKGGALAENPFAALTFFWPVLERQVRIEGSVFRLPENESDDYFNSRPYASRVGAWASEQSREIETPAARSASAALGRLHRAPRTHRILAGQTQPSARPHLLHSEKRPLAEIAARTLSTFQAA